MSVIDTIKELRNKTKSSDELPGIYGQDHSSKSILGALIILLISIVFLPLKTSVAEQVPFAAVLIGFLIFLLPGYFLSVVILPEDELLERIPLAVVLSGALLSIPAFTVLTLHGNIHHFVWAHIGITALTSIPLVVRVLRKSFSGSDIQRDKIHLALIILLLAGAGLIFYISINMPLIGDDWVSFPWLWHIQTEDHILASSPYHGIHLETSTRQEFALLMVDFGYINYTSGLGLFNFYTLFRPLLTIISILSFFSLARGIFQRRSAAVFATIIWMIVLFINLGEDRAGYHLVVRIAQDKFYLRFIVLPIALRLLLDYLNKKDKRFLWLFLLASWAVGTTHPIGPAMLGLASASFGLLHLILNHDRQTLWRLIIIGLIVAVGMLIPAYQLLDAQESAIALSLDGSSVDPNFNSRVRLATRAGRLLFYDNGDYILHPLIFHERLKFAAFLLPLWLWKAIKDTSARLVVGMYALIGIFYIPDIIMIIGSFVTPWLLWRIAWVPEWGSWLILSGSAWITVDAVVKSVKWISKKLSAKARSPSASFSLTWNTASFLGIITITSALTPLLYENYQSIMDLLVSNRKSTCTETAPALKILADNVKSKTIVLSSRDVNFCIPAYSPLTKVIEYRGSVTLTRFANADRLDEAWQRLEDEAYFSSTYFVNEKIMDIIERQDVHYVVVPDDRYLKLQFDYLNNWFTLIGGENGYSVYQVLENRPYSAIVTGNSYLTNHDFRKSETEFKEALLGSNEEVFLANIGLSYASLEQGKIDLAIEFMEEAISLQPGEGVARAWLGALYMTANRPESALLAYKEANLLLPNMNSIMLNLADGYQAVGKIHETEKLYAEIARLSAPAGSAYYFRLMGNNYQRAKMFDKAISSYQQALRLDPKEPYLSAVIGDLYLTMGEQTQAEDRYRSLLKDNPWDFLSLIGVGQIYSQQENFDASIETYERAITIDPTNPQLLDLYATEIYKQNGGIEEVIEALQNTLSYKLQVPAVQSELADQYTSIEKYSEAILLYHKAMLGDSTRMGNYRLSIADAEFLNKNYETAIVDYLKSEELGAIPIQLYNTLGSRYLFLGKINQAKGEYYKVVLTNPYSDVAHNNLGLGLLSFADWEAAINEFELSIALSPSSIGGHLFLGDTYSKLGQYNQAAEHYRKILDLIPDNLLGYIKLASTYQILGEFEQAEELLIRAVEMEVDEYSIPLALGDTYLFEQNFTSAMNFYQDAINAEPTKTDAYRKLSDTFLRQGDIDGAIRTLENSIHDIPDELSTYQRLAELELIRDHPDAVLNWLNKGVEALPDSGSPYIYLADEYLRRGDIKAALKNYNRAMVIEPELVDAYTKPAMIYKNRGRYDDAEAIYLTGISAIPSSNGLYIALGDLYLIQNRLDEAELIYRQALEIPPISPNVYLAISNVQIRRGDLDSAFSTLEEATQVLPAPAETYNSLADLYFQYGNIPQAEKYYRLSIMVNPKLSDGYFGLSKVAQLLGNMEEAQNSLEENVIKDPLSTTPYSNLASYFESQGKIDRAETNYLKLIQLDPLNTSNYVTVSQFYRRQERYPEALDILQNGLIIPPKTASLLTTIGNIYLELDQPATALRWYDAGMNLDPSYIGPYLSLSGYYQGEGDWDSAIKSLTSGVESNQNNASLFLNLGNLYLKLNHKDLAEDAYLKACSLDPSQVDCRIGLASIYQNSQDWSNAIAQLEIASYYAPTVLSPYTQLGKTYQYMGEYGLADHAYSHGIHSSYDRSNAFLARAGFYSTRGEWDNALSDYQAAWSHDPNSQTVGNALAQYLINRGEWKEGELILAALIESPEVIASTYINLGSLYSSRGNWSLAIQAYEDAIRTDDKALEAYTGLARVYESIDNYDEALDIYYDATVANPDNPSGFITLGDAYLNRLDYDAAQEAYARALEIDPNYFTAWWRFDTLSWIKGDGGIDLTPLIELAETTPTGWEFYILGLINLSRNNLDTALDFYQQAIKFDPYNPDAWWQLGNYYRSQEEWDQATEAFNTALTYRPFHTSSLMSLGSIQESLDQLENALDPYRLAVESAPNLQSGYIVLAKAQYGLENEILDAEGIIDGINQADLDDDTLQNNRSSLYRLDDFLETSTVQIGSHQIMDEIYVHKNENHNIFIDTDQALDTLYQGLEAIPASAGIYQTLGEIYANMEIITQALEINQTGLEIIPGSTDLYINRGSILEGIFSEKYKELQIAEAGVEFGEYKVDWANSIRIEENNRPWTIRLVDSWEEYLWSAENQYEYAEGLYNQALIDLEAAKDAYQEATRLDPGNVSALLGLGRLTAMAESMEEGLPYYKDAVTLNPTLPAALISLGNAYLELNQPDDALREFESAIEYSPNHLGAAYGFFRASTQLTQKDLNLGAQSLQYGQYWWNFTVNFLRRNQLSQ